MQNFLFTNNNLSAKSKTIYSSNNRSFNNNKKKGSIVSKLMTRKICYCFKNNLPFTLKNGIKIEFNDCTNLREAIIKYSGIISRIRAQKQQKIRINGQSYQPMTNESYIKSINASFADHFECFCIVNNINGQYNSSN